MIDAVAFGLTVVSGLAGIGVALLATVGRYRWRRVRALLAWIELATIAQVLLAAVGLLRGHRPGEPTVLLAYLATAVLVLPVVAVQVHGDDERWAGLLTAAGLVVLAVVIVRAQTTWRA